MAARYKFHRTLPCQREKLGNLGYRPAKRKEDFNIDIQLQYLVVITLSGRKRRQNGLNYAFVCLFIYLFELGKVLVRVAPSMVTSVNCHRNVYTLFQNGSK